MPYNLPNAWSPGYALPNYVQAEGIGRGAFITKWLPRGTYGPAVVDYCAVPVAQMRSIARQGNAVAYGVAARGVPVRRLDAGSALPYGGRALSGTIAGVDTKVVALGAAAIAAVLYFRKKRRGR